VPSRSQSIIRCLWDGVVLSDGRRAFITVTRDSFEGLHILRCLPEAVVVEILENVEPDDWVMAADSA